MSEPLLNESGSGSDSGSESGSGGSGSDTSSNGDTEAHSPAQSGPVRDGGSPRPPTQRVLNDGLAQMLESGVIMDVSSVDEARTAEAAGAVAVMALDMVPSRIRARGGIARMASIKLIKDIKQAVSIPVMAKCRIGHRVEAAVLQSVGVDFVDESEVLTQAAAKHLDKHAFTVPFVCGARNLGEALRRIQEGASMIRTKGEAGTGDVRHAVDHFNSIAQEIQELKNYVAQNPDMGWVAAFCYKERITQTALVYETLRRGRLPVVTFAAGGIATPADAAFMMELGADGVFVGSGIFESSEPAAMAGAICHAVHNYAEPEVVARACATSGEAMSGIIPAATDVTQASASVPSSEPSNPGLVFSHGRYAPDPERSRLRQLHRRPGSAFSFPPSAQWNPLSPLAGHT